MGERLKLVGRRSEHAALERALAALPRGGSRILEVVGEPGIGKSRLLAETRELAGARDALVFAGVAAEFERDLPFGVFVDALDPYLGSLPASRLRGLGEEQSRRVAAVFPALADLAPPLGGLGEERYRSHHAVRALIELLALQRPCVLTLDDLHWADQGSLELIGHLLRRPPAGPVLLALAFRPRQAGPLLTAPLEAAARQGRLERLELAPLTRADVGELLGDSIPDSQLDRLYAESGGNPFYLEQLAKAGEELAESAEQLATAADSAPTPGSVRAALAQELDLLAPAARRVVEAAAIGGEPFDPALAAAIAEVDEAAAIAAIDEAIELGLVHTGDSPRVFRFRHPIVRAAVYESSGEAWRSAAHARAAAALAAAGAPASARAEHVARSARPGDDAAMAVLAEAGHATIALAPATAARWFQAALELLPPERADSRLELLIPLTRALGSAGRLEESHRALGEVLELLPPALSSLRPRILGFLALIDRLLGRPGAGRALLEEGLAGLPDPSSSSAASLQIELASDRFFVGDWAGMREWALPARELALKLGSRGLLATATALLALAEYSVDDVAAALPLMDEAERLVDGDDSSAPDLRLDAFDWLSWCELSMERYDQALVHLEAGLRLGRETGQGHLLMTMRFGALFAKTWQGRLDEALEDSDATIELARLSGSPQLMSWALTLRCWLVLRRGEVDEALALGEESRRLASSVTPNPFSLVGAGWLAEARVEAGAPAAGRNELLRMLGGDELPLIERAFRPYLYEVLARAELALRRVDAAAGWAERGVAAVEGIELPGRRAFALRASAAVALAEGRARDAAELALEAAELAGVAHRIEAARSRALAGRALAETGDPAGAAALLHAAHDELEACGATRYCDLAVRDLRRLGERIGRPGRRRGTDGDGGLASLSQRELEVARLVTDRLTNREIADRLVLSQKTVERHMDHIFRKLGVGSRVEVARAVEASERANV
jgi:ATP/maltotriose-dependent transcriptional regulator MalT